MNFCFKLTHDSERKPAIVAILPMIYTDLQTLRMWHIYLRKWRLLIDKVPLFKKTLFDKLPHFDVRYLWTCLMFQWNQMRSLGKSRFVIYVPIISANF